MCVTDLKLAGAKQSLYQHLPGIFITKYYYACKWLRAETPRKRFLIDRGCKVDQSTWSMRSASSHSQTYFPFLNIVCLDLLKMLMRIKYCSGLTVHSHCIVHQYVSCLVCMCYSMQHDDVLQCRKRQVLLLLLLLHCCSHSRRYKGTLHQPGWHTTSRRQLSHVDLYHPEHQYVITD